MKKLHIDMELSRNLSFFPQITGIAGWSTAINGPENGAVS